ncbi:hypothetical protein DZF40_07145 [Salmonella enterica]|uniref:Uncharacterized protein n=2 Tax=Salmonella enterica I TaxID=59201 RepID=A0A5W9BTR6_SALON|nr:hypothetical protein SEEO0250_015045 [Salmonella enterica subsp. enterica serovar Oranienburg str. 0250]AYP86789.1 hypothetical protein EAE36_15290 [Salmonella enterica subsp. enterica serovar Oranienburg]EAA0916231.1 hypothetical protein [Salmonella enterica subsp. enterica serovar Telelkebir]EAA1019532.1 hypothetical protein [Salmonella enterica subsp. enterica serovar Bredeney]EAA3109319.1 hypothetical protein [Salmonella enterica subsp. enterica serovar Duisburg]EAA7341712.1 hypothetica
MLRNGSINTLFRPRNHPGLISATPLSILQFVISLKRLHQQAIRTNTCRVTLTRTRLITLLRF